MRKYPMLVINGNVIRENSRLVNCLCKRYGISIAGVVKGCCAHPGVATRMSEGGCEWLADSRMDNIKSLRDAGISCRFMLLRVPMLSEIPDVVRYADSVLVSMPETLLAIDDACIGISREYGVIVSIDVGDLREGMLPDELDSFIKTVGSCRKIRIDGVATNLGCFGGVLPSQANMAKLLEVAHKLEHSLGYPIKIVSGGATSSIKMLEEGAMPEGINHLRIGEAIMTGEDTSGCRKIDWLNQNAFILYAEVVEVKIKPSTPEGEIGADAFGSVPVFVDRGVRKRAILGIGKQDLRIEGITPMDKGIEVLGASSDHLILDVEEYPGCLKIGDILGFRLNYGAMLSACTSRYVTKSFI